MPKPLNPRSKRRPLGPMVDVAVTAEIINTAVRGHSGHCMIADAIRAAVPNAKKVAVDISTCRWSDFDRGYRYVFLTPRVAQEALVDFDEGVPARPFKFRLRGAHVSRAGGRPKSKASRAKDHARLKQQRKERAELPKRATLVSRDGEGAGARVPHRVGGRRPPQLHIRREYGMRAFRAATLRQARAEQPNPEEVSD